MIEDRDTGEVYRHGRWWDRDELREYEEDKADWIAEQKMGDADADV